MTFSDGKIIIKQECKQILTNIEFSGEEDTRRTLAEHVTRVPFPIMVNELSGKACVEHRAKSNWNFLFNKIIINRS